MRGQRRLAAGTVRHDLVALIQKISLVDLGQRPPHRLDVALIERPVGAHEIEPKADPFGQPIPLGHVLEYRGAALGVEALDPHIPLDLGLGGDAQFLFDGDLDRQPVAVPAALALDPIAAHGLKARVDVLEDTRQDVMRARGAVRGRRPLVEHPLRRVLAQSQ